MEIFKGVSGLYYLLILLAGGALLERLIPWRRMRRIEEKWVPRHFAHVGGQDAGCG